MSLNTLIEIGSKLKSSKNGIHHHKYVRPCPADNKKVKVLRLNLPVQVEDQGISFDFDSEKFGVIQSEKIIGNEAVESKLLYLRYKTADKANSITIYFFGDLFYSGGDKNYKLGQDIKYGKPIVAKIKKFEKGSDSHLVRFFESFEKSKSIFDDLLRYNEGVAEFLELKEEEKREMTLSKLVRDPADMRKFTAKRCFCRLKKSPAVFKKFYKGRSPEWGEIENKEVEQKRLVDEFSSGAIFIHFDFGDKSWYEMEKDMELIFEALNHDFLDNPKLPDNLTFKKILFRGICSGDEQNDKQFPNFNLDDKRKSRGFSKDEIESLFYGVGLLDKGFALNQGDLRMIVLPTGKKLKAEDYEKFFGKIGSKEEEETNEEKVEKTEKILERKNSDAFLNFMELPDDFEKNILRYDLILAIKGQNTTSDMVEIQGIQRSFLRQVYARLRDKKDEVYEKIASSREKSTYGVGIYISLSRLLGKVRVEEIKDESEKKGKIKVPKYEGGSKLESHLLKNLPKIFTSTYYDDDRLLPATIERIELFIRQGLLSSKQSWHVEMLIFDLEFLLSIQNTSTENQKFLQIMASKSYELGKNLGRFALFFKPTKSDYTPINSFDQEYVGNLRRQIGQLSELQKFAAMLFEKYHSHKHRKKFIHWDIQNGEVVENITRLGAEMDEAGYDKNECAFGFFESYFERFKEKSLQEKLQALLEKHENEEAHAELIQSVQQVVNQFN